MHFLCAQLLLLTWINKKYIFFPSKALILKCIISFFIVRCLSKGRLNVCLSIIRQWFFLTENPQIIHWPNVNVSGTHPCEDNNCDDMCFSLVIVLLANVMFCFLVTSVGFNKQISCSYKELSNDISQTAFPNRKESQ